jgi:hypothetical protein
MALSVEEWCGDYDVNSSFVGGVFLLHRGHAAQMKSDDLYLLFMAATS